jgi:hypothetical protein
MGVEFYAVKKHKTSKAWMHEHVNDTYVQRAKAEGYRSRAAFKLMEIDDKDHLLRPGMRGGRPRRAPGGWSQVAAERVGGAGRSGTRPAGNGAAGGASSSSRATSATTRPGGTDLAGSADAGGPCDFRHGPQYLGYRRRSGARGASGRTGAGFRAV